MGSFASRITSSLALFGALQLASCAGGGGVAPVTSQQPGSGVSSGTTTPSGSQTLYVGNIANYTDSSVTTYPADASGNVSPTSTLAGSLTGLADTSGIAIDATGNIYVANTLQSSSPLCITIYPPNASGNTAPSAQICGANTGIRSALADITFDGAGNLYVTTFDSGEPGAGSVLVFAPGATGNVAPIRTISGIHTGLAFPEGIAVDATGNVFVTNAGGGPCGELGSVTEYAPGASGDAAPIAFLSGSQTGISFPLSIALDGAGNVYVDHQSVIAIFAAGAHGNVAPIASISGLATKLVDSEGLTLDPAGNIYATDLRTVVGGAILVYPPLAELRADGQTPPTRIISGSNTGLDYPVPIAIH